MLNRPPAFGPALRRQMLPLAALALVLVGVVLPALYQRMALAERAGEAQTWARHLANRLEVLARARPELWGFDQVAVEELAAPLLGQPVLAQVQVDTARADAVFTAGAPAKDPVLGWATVQIDGRRVGRVAVALDASHVRGETRRLWWAATVAGVLLGLLLFFLPVRAVRRADARNTELFDALEDANTHLEARVAARTAELAQRERELQELGNRLVAVQEEERTRISRDLHDDLGQTLTGLRLRLTALEPSVAPAGKKHVDAALEAVDGAVEEVRRLAHNLRPPALDALGATAALTAHAERWAEAAGLELTIELADATPPAPIGEVIFRVGQEALTNIARHAQAEHVVLRIGPADDGWRLQVEDDGVGMQSSSGGLGLVGARERVEALGGYLDVEPGPAGGVLLTAWLPPEQ